MSFKLIHLVITQLIAIILLIILKPSEKYVTCDYNQSYRPFPSGNIPQESVVNVVY